MFRSAGLPVFTHAGPPGAPDAPFALSGRIESDNDVFFEYGYVWLPYAIAALALLAVGAVAAVRSRRGSTGLAGTLITAGAVLAIAAADHRRAGRRGAGLDRARADRPARLGLDDRPPHAGGDLVRDRGERRRQHHRHGRDRDRDRGTAVVARPPLGRAARRGRRRRRRRTRPGRQGDDRPGTPARGVPAGRGVQRVVPVRPRAGLRRDPGGGRGGAAAAAARHLGQGDADRGGHPVRGGDRRQPAVPGRALGDRRARRLGHRPDLAVLLCDRPVGLAAPARHRGRGRRRPACDGSAFERGGQASGRPTA